MTATKDKALAKMLEEITDKTTPQIHRIHNWICYQEDEELFNGILKKGKTLNEAYEFITSKARELAVNGSIFIEDDDVFSWVKEYYASDKIVVDMPVKKIPTPKKSEPLPDEILKVVNHKPKPTKKKSKEESGQMTIFDFLD
ncbi:hypothetical protein BG261_05540 [Floricoccus tropicus]|uniref:PcfK-like protein n=1 Tax=Floricoccus tropicus TaxID=1859473 RepID=A0A1E8GKR5_9LACT|nr:Cas9 inhibitor AcrIIA9 family protein [Floricoccus tropicus]OFI48852.1 hypothetical protein BG261_05540 [Floricoccus tropicus]